MRLKITCSVLALAAALPAPAAAAEMFNRIATFPVVSNLPADRDASQPTVSEIIAATADGMTLVYTDSPQEAVGMIDIADAAAPKPAGFVPLGGEPTSVVISGGKALVGVVDHDSTYVQPAGRVAVVDIAGKSVEATCDLGGQPDSLALSPDGRFLAVAVENERDEELNDGAIPQLPAGFVVVLPVADNVPDCAGKTVVDLTGLAETAPEDPEPEFVDINGANEIVVSIQENNHLAVIDAASGTVKAHFPAGSVDLADIDAKDDGVIAPVDAQQQVKREPDAVHWLDDERFVTANEGDYEGGSRGFTIFGKAGDVLFDSGSALEHLAVRIGHYPDKRSDAKGVEPEGIEVATFGDDRLIFVGTERSSFVAVYRDTGTAPELLQVLPSGIGPEGLLAIPARNLFVTANETDLVEDGGARSVVMVYQRSEGPAAYPTIVADDGIGWGALSGVAADASEPGKLHAVTDSAYSQAQILTIDAGQTPAKIVRAVTVTADGKPMEGLDLEGIAARAEGGFWLASEGNPKKDMANRLIRVDAEGVVQEVVPLPHSLAADATASGLEGVAVTGSGGDEMLWAAQQREWGSDEKGFVKLIGYRPASGEWSYVRYPLDAADAGWIGLSEITALADGRFAIIERDNLLGDMAKAKKLYAVSLDGLAPGKPGEDAPVVEKTLLRDLLPELASAHGYVLDKVESFAVDAGGNAFIITDNDGVDDSSGETQFLPLGAINLSN